MPPDRGTEVKRVDRNSSAAWAWWLVPMNAWGRRQQRATAAVFTGLAALFAAATSRFFGGFWQQSDASWYRDLAAGRTSGVIQPFASRQLYPLVVRGIAAMLHWPVNCAFIAVGAACLLVTLAVVFTLMTRTAAPRWMLAAVAVLPFWPQLWAGLVLPDIWYAAMIAVLLLLLEKRLWWAAAAMMLPLMLSRESTTLTLLCLLLAGWRQLRWRWATVAVASAGAGAWIVHRLTAGNPGNREGLPQSLYLLGKIAWNGLRNLFGIRPWSNLYPLLCRQPRWLWHVHAGPLNALGVCGVDGTQPRMLLLAEITVFGLLPYLALALWLRQRKQWRENVLLRFCLIYGGIGLLLAPLLGTATGRLVGYAWPLPLAAAPMLTTASMRGRRAGALLLLHLALCIAGLLLLKAG